MKELKRPAAQKALEFIRKGKRTKYHRAWFSQWSNHAVMSDHHLSSASRGYWAKNPELGAEVHMVQYALKKIGFKDILTVEDLKELREATKAKFLKEYFFPQIKYRNGVFPHMNKTQAIKELLARGWVHRSDFDLDYKKVIIECHISPLVWPEQFEVHQDALAVMDKFGIPGHTGTKLPKS